METAEAVEKIYEDRLETRIKGKLGQSGQISDYALSFIALEPGDRYFDRNAERVYAVMLFAGG